MSIFDYVLGLSSPKVLDGITSVFKSGKAFSPPSGGMMLPPNTSLKDIKSGVDGIFRTNNKPTLKGAYPTTKPSWSDARDLYNNTPSTQTSVPELADSLPGASNYDDIIAAINSLGGGGSFNYKQAQSSVDKSYKPAYAALDKLRNANKKQNAGDINEVLKIYSMLSGDYNKTAGSTGSRYDQSTSQQKGNFDKSIADVNSRYDNQIQSMVAELTRLGQTQAIETETNKLNKQRNAVLDNLMQGSSNTTSALGRQKNSAMDFFTAGAGGAKLRGADKAADLKRALSDALRGIDNNQMQLDQSKASDLAKSYQSWQSSIGDASKNRLDALFKLADLQRNDAYKTWQMSQPQNGSSQQNTSRMNPMQKADAFLTSSGLDQNTAQNYLAAFQKMITSKPDFASNNFIPGGQTSPVNMTTARAMQLANEYATENNLPDSVAQMLVRLAANSY